VCCESVECWLVFASVIYACHFWVTSFLCGLRGVFQFGDLHLGHCLGFSVLFCHVFPHRRHVHVGSFGMSWGSMIFSFTIFLFSFLYYDNHKLVYKGYS
jgi:hypothetical protein